MKTVSILLLLLGIAAIGCSKHEAAPQQGSNDSLLSKPLDPVQNPVAVHVPDSFKQYVDLKRVRTPEHLATMKRFTPSEVVIVYRDFRPLRKKGVTPESAEVTTFLTEHKITLVELKAILEEGDRLGWSKNR